MKARNIQKSPSRRLLGEMFTELGHVVRQSIADSWLVRISLATTAFLILSFVFTRVINVLTTDGFGPHGACLLWLPSLITLYVGSDTLIGLAYVSISATLIYLVYRARPTIPYQWVFVAFGIFIIACGTGHFVDVWTLWVPVYWLSGMVKLLTALASVTTALALPPLVPKVLDLIHLASVSDERQRQLEQAHSELEVLYEKSQHLDRLKTTFFANVSHDLRTPLTLILGPLDALLAAQQLTEQQYYTLRVVQGNALMLLKRVNDLLVVAQLEAGQMTLNIAEIDLARLLRGCTANFELLAQDRQITFTVGGLTSLLAYLDAEKFQHICLNLLSNAFKFAPDGGSVRCVLSREGEWGMITVQDNGPGIKPEMRQAIFERFWHGEDNPTPRFRGTGLGLAIVKEFVELHDGTITAGNAPEGGALFTVKLPLDALAPSCSQAALHLPVFSEEQAVPPSPLDEEQATLFLADLSLEQMHQSDMELASERELKESSQTLVLVVEDHQQMARFLVNILAPEYRVVVARDGLDGLEKALALRPDLILCDLMMPRMSGEQFITQIRAHSTLDGIPIMVISARADDALRIQLLCEGVSEYLVKPFFQEELRAKAATLIAMKLTRQVLQQEVTTQDQSLVILAREVALRKQEGQRALEELRRVNKQLTHASQVQRNFVAIVSHEFRTSLASVQGFAELMCDETLEPEEMKEYAADIYSEALRLGRMLTDLLDLERMKSGRMHLLRERVKLNALISEVLERVRAISSLHTFNLQLHEELPDCMGDKDKLSQVIANLLSNAIKYSPDGGEIIVGSQVEQEMVRVWVQDHGVGIPPESLEEVFVPYSRIEAGTTRYIKGTGLGLSIVRQVIQMHGGHVWVESRLGQGSRFHFTVPLA